MDANQVELAAAAVAADPLDGSALRRLGHAFAARKDKHDAIVALNLAGRAFATAGQLPMAIVVARELQQVDAPSASRLVDELASAYGKGSTRVDPAFHAGPPRPPEHDALPVDHTVAPDEVLDVVRRAAAAIDQHAATPLPAIPLFHALGPRAFRLLATQARVVEHEAGARIVEVGTPGEAFYVVARGTVTISRPDDQDPAREVVLGHLRGGAFFGEMALLTDSPRAARATAQSRCVLLEIARRTVDELAAQSEELAAVLADYTRDRLLRNLMLTSAVFARLEPEARERVIRRFSTRIYEAGAPLIEEGASSATLLVLVSGRVVVEKRDRDQQPIEVTTLGPGDVVGEISLLTRRPATATVRAERKTVALALTRDDFNDVFGEFPAVLSHLYQLAVARERDLERLLASEVVEADEYLI